MKLSHLLQGSFRPSHSQSAGSNLLRTLVQTVFFWGIFLAAVPAVIVSAERALGVPRFDWSQQRLVGWSIFACAGLLGLASGATMAVVGRGTPLPMSCPVRLVAVGPYRWIRNPMAVAGLAQGAAVALILGSWTTIAYVVVGALFWHIFVRPIEEADLLKRFGADYVAYRAAVRCWIPHIRAFQGSDVALRSDVGDKGRDTH